MENCQTSLKKKFHYILYTANTKKITFFKLHLNFKNIHKFSLVQEFRGKDKTIYNLE